LQRAGGGICPCKTGEAGAAWGGLSRCPTCPIPTPLRSLGIPPEDPAAAPGAPRGLRALDADGEVPVPRAPEPGPPFSPGRGEAGSQPSSVPFPQAGGAEQDPGGVAGGAPPRHPPAQDLQAVSRQSPAACLPSSFPVPFRA